MISLQNKQGQQDESHLCLHLSSGHHVYMYLYIYICMYVYHTLFSHNNPSNKAFSHDNYWWKCSLMNMWRISWQFFINITMQTLWSPNNICRFSQHFTLIITPLQKKTKMRKMISFHTTLCMVFTIRILWWHSRKTKVPSSFAWHQDLRTTVHLVIWLDIRTCCCERISA